MYVHICFKVYYVTYSIMDKSILNLPYYGCTREHKK